MNKYLKDSLVGQKHPLWQPTCTITSATASTLMEIEAARTVMEHTPLPFGVQEKLRRRARAYSLSKNYRQFVGTSSAMRREGAGR